MEDDYFGKEPWSYGGINTVKDHNKNLSLEAISTKLAKNDIYTRFKQYRKPVKYSPIYVFKKRELFQADVVFFTDPEMIKVKLVE